MDTRLRDQLVMHREWLARWRAFGRPRLALQLAFVHRVHERRIEADRHHALLAQIFRTVGG